jgi:MtrB/PioB family decaheme-associated outer membrane protein
MSVKDRDYGLKLNALTVACLVALGPQAWAQQDATVDGEDTTSSGGPDTSQYLCERCPFPEAWTGYVLFGGGYVSSDFSDFGDFGGLEEKGLYAGLGADLIRRWADGRYLDLYADRLGLNSRTLSLQGGRQGDYDVHLDYAEISRFRTMEAQTIFVGAGTANQQLPPGWVREVSTDQMPLLQDSLRNHTIGTDRKTLGLGLAWQRQSPWNYRLDVERTRKEGSRIQGAPFIFHAAELVAPVDFQTTRVDAAVGYAGKNWELETAYNLSMFSNRRPVIRFENPFTGMTIGDDAGELSQPPDNQFHQLMLSGSWRHSRWMTLAGQVAIGRAEQNEQFLQPSVNPQFADIGLPRNDLDGRINTRIANVRLTSNLTNRLNARVQVRYDERDNATPTDSFVEVATDTFLGRSRTNRPFGYERLNMNAALNYRLSSAYRLGAMVERREMKRTFQEVHETTTDGWSVFARATPFSRLSLNARYTHEERSNDLDPALLGPQETPTLRRFHFAEKEREAYRLSADYAITDNLVAGLYYENAREDFRDTEIGVSKGRDEIYGLDLSLSLGNGITAHAYVAEEFLRADIHGVDMNIGEPWMVRQKDDFRTAGFGLSFNKLPGQWIQASLDFTYARADGELLVDKRGSAPAFPELETRRLTLEASAERKLNENLDLRLAYAFGKLAEEDFYRQDVTPDAVGALLSLGFQPLDRTVHVGSIMLRYRFN